MGESVRKAIDDWTQVELDAAMLHACNAVDGTAKKVYPQRMGNKARFTRLLRDNYNILGPMGAPNVDVENTRFPVKVIGPPATGEFPDLADVIYGIHRCTHGHGDELPDGFELLQDATGPPGQTRLRWERGRVRLSDRVIFGLLAVAVLSSVNTDQGVPDGYVLTLGEHVLPINDWWGKSEEFQRLVEAEGLISVKLDFGNWIDTAT